MTRLINLLDLIYTSNYDAYFLASKENIKEGDIIIAQSKEEEETELWFTVVDRIKSVPLKSGYVFFIIKRIEK